MKVSIENKKIRIIVNQECSLDELLEMVEKFDYSPEWDEYELVISGEQISYFASGYSGISYATCSK